MSWLTKLKAQYIPYYYKGDMGYFFETDNNTGGG
nr:MAG TPA: hypothetical protein [Caudoviricetes sp.]